MANDNSGGDRVEARVDGALAHLERVLVAHIRKASETSAARERMLYQQVVSYVDLRAILGTEHDIPPLRGFAISPDMSLYLLRLLDQLRPAALLELGSGFSSVVLGFHCLREGGRVTSLDHDESYAKKTLELIRRWKLESVVDVLVAPMEAHETGEDAPVPFYGTNGLASTGQTFDFVFVDGPPMSFSPTVRRGFLPLFSRFLRPGCHILLDDYYRQGEQTIVSAWVESGIVDVVEISTDLEKHAAHLVYRGGN